MAKAKDLIEATLEKKPIDVKAIVEDIMKDKAKEAIQGAYEDYTVLEGHAEVEEVTEEVEELTEEEQADLDAFMADFTEKYGDLPVEEQETILAGIFEEMEAEAAEVTEDTEEQE